MFQARSLDRLFGGLDADFATRTVLAVGAQKCLVRDQMTDLLARIRIVVVARRSTSRQSQNSDQH